MTAKNLLDSLKQRFQYQLYRKLMRLIDYGARVERYEIASKRATIHPSVKLLPNANFVNLKGDPNQIQIGENSVILGQLLVLPHGGRIEIGNDCYIGLDSRIWSADSVKIGNRVAISHNVNIHDTDSHSTDPDIRRHHYAAIMSNGHPETNNFDIKSRAIQIEDDVWICFNSTILKGVKIGRGSIISASAVVTKDVPEYVVVAGNPARVIKRIYPYEEFFLDKVSVTT